MSTVTLQSPSAARSPGAMFVFPASAPVRPLHGVSTSSATKKWDLLRSS